MNAQDKIEKRFDKLFFACPGAWFGNCPRDGHSGHISIDPAETVAAVAFFKRRRVNIVSTRVISCGDPRMTFDLIL